MSEYGSMGDDYMFRVKKRYSRARLGILLIVIGLLWFVQKAGGFPSGIFGPSVLFTFGAWMVAVSYLHKRQVPPR